MKTKRLIIMLLAIFALWSCSRFNQQDAKVLIKRRVPKAINIQEFSNGQLALPRLYVAVDSNYTIYMFKVGVGGDVNLVDSISSK